MIIVLLISHSAGEINETKKWIKYILNWMKKFQYNGRERHSNKKLIWFRFEYTFDSFFTIFVPQDMHIIKKYKFDYYFIRIIHFPAQTNFSIDFYIKLATGGNLIVQVQRRCRPAHPPSPTEN